MIKHIIRGVCVVMYIVTCHHLSISLIMLGGLVNYLDMRTKNDTYSSLNVIVNTAIGKSIFGHVIHQWFAAHEKHTQIFTLLH